ncbi:MAG: hypothetical protein H6999_01395 [Hahellaceae bacterium]|nr:hypothetical protein [Hahellaceae bacterium]MCP5168407.1 hypothetical protein [Hahellaceae bacterium]
MKTTILRALFVLCLFPLSIASPVLAEKSTTPTLQIPHSAESVIALLPEDADLSNLERQKRAMQRGFYWTKDRTIKPLDRKS